MENVLQVRNLTKRFGALIANENVSVDLRAGEVHAVIGPNGAGKSTLIAQICGSLKPDEGSVWIQGENVTHLPTHSRARLGLGRTFQISALAMEDTVLQNAVLGALGASGSPWRFLKPVLADVKLKQKAQAALERVGLEPFLDRKVAQLSHGQRRQLEVGIALTMAPKAFILDEPMAGLSGEGTRQLTEILSDLRAETPVLLVEHDMDVVFALADRVTVLDYGRVLATGTASEVRQNPEVQQAYLGDTE